MIETQWQVSELDEVKTDIAERLAFKMKVPHPVATVYVQRGLTTPAIAEEFFEITRKKMHNPYLLPDIEPALERLNRAIDNQEHIYVHGDYDVDGITSCTVVTRALTMMGAKFEYHVPHRMLDGYDIKEPIVEKALAAKADLLLSVDCGIVAFGAADLAAKNNLDLIITDHHHPSDDGRLPTAIAVINPNRHDSKYPFSGLAGVGIAFKVMVALGHSRGFPVGDMIKELLEFVALGTVADVAPMIDENRILVALGCEYLTNTEKPGVRELLNVAGIKTVTPTSIGFGLGPRINAIGRLDDSGIALRLMMETSPSRAKALAMQLDTANKRRQAKQVQHEKEAIALLPEDMEEMQIIVLASPSWHKGLVGLVAGKLAERYGRPALVCTVMENGAARGSCRSTRHFDILQALLSPGCKELFTKVGGHAFAAGFDLPAENLPILAERLNAYAKAKRGATEPSRILEIDAEIMPGDISMRTLEALSRMAPFGQSGNPEPMFLCRGLKIQSIGHLGKEGKHLKINLKGPLRSHYGLSGKWWRHGDLLDQFPKGAFVDVVFTMGLDEFMGRNDLSLTISDMRLCDDQPESED